MKLPETVDTEDRALAWDQSRIALAFNILWEQYRARGLALLIGPGLKNLILNVGAIARQQDLNNESTAELLASEIMVHLFGDLNKSVGAIDPPAYADPAAVAADMVAAIAPPVQGSANPLTEYQQGVVDGTDGAQPATDSEDYKRGYVQGQEIRQGLTTFQPAAGLGKSPGAYDDAYGASNPAGL